MKSLFFQISILILFFLFLPVSGQVSDTLAKAVPADSSLTSFGLFEKDDLLEMTLRFNIGSYLRYKVKKESMKADFILNPGKPDSLSRKIKLKTRGTFRNAHCVYAPIELNFKSSDFGYSDLDKLDKVKLVNQCSSGPDDENFLLREYLVYKLFNVLTDTSLRVRLFRINYIDSEKKKKAFTHYGFLIEPVGMLAQRTNTIQVKTTSLTQKHIFQQSMDRLAIFNYMIGNFDWSVPGQHNVEVLKSASDLNSQTGIIIPYDFDWSGIVNATYAIPAEETGVNSVRERLFLGICRNKEVFWNDLDVFIADKDRFYNVINSFPYLKERDKADITHFLDGFYDQLKGNRSVILQILQSSCKNF